MRDLTVMQEVPHVRRNLQHICSHRPPCTASKRCSKVASGFGQISSFSSGGAMGSVGTDTIRGSLAKGSMPVVARTGSVLETTRTGLMTLACARVPAFRGPNQQRLPCTTRYCQYPARSDVGGKLVWHSAYAGSTDERTVHEMTATNAPRCI